MAEPNSFPADGKDLRREIIDTACALPRLGLTKGRSGNISARTKSGFLVTPSWTPLEDRTEDRIAVRDLDGRNYGEILPSSERRMHLEFYPAKPDSGAVVHCLRRSVSAFHHMVALAGGDRMNCAAYESFGKQTNELEDGQAAAFELPKQVD